MKTDKVTQVICISETDAAAFEERMNDALSSLANPEILFDPNRSFTAVIVYNVRRDVPESVLELFNMVDGSHHSCSECPRCVEQTDQRRKWTTCSATGQPIRIDGSVCEKYYLIRYKALSEAAGKYKELPYTVE